MECECTLRSVDVLCFLAVHFVWKRRGMWDVGQSFIPDKP